jgi:hypothetical protein
VLSQVTLNAAYTISKLSNRSRKDELLAAKEIVALTNMGAAFHAAKNPHFVNFVEELSPGSSARLKGRQPLTTKTLPLLGSVVRRWEELKMSQAPAFSVTFDCWTSGAQRVSLLALTFSYLNDGNYLNLSLSYTTAPPFPTSRDVILTLVHCRLRAL